MNPKGEEGFPPLLTSFPRRSIPYATMPTCDTRDRHFVPHGYPVSFRGSRLYIVLLRFRTALTATSGNLSLKWRIWACVQNPAHFLSQATLVSPRKANNINGEDAWGSRAARVLLLKESRNAVHVGIEYILFKFCTTVGRLAPVGSGWLKIYSQYLVNSSVTSF